MLVWLLVAFLKLLPIPGGTSCQNKQGLFSVTNSVYESVQFTLTIIIMTNNNNNCV